MTCFKNERIAFSLLLLCLFFGCSISAMAQRFSVFQNREYQLYLNQFARKDSIRGSFLDDGLIQYQQIAEMQSEIYPRKQRKNYFARKLRQESFIKVKSEDFYFQLDPVFDFNAGRDLTDSLNEKLITNSRGLWLRGNVGKQFAFESYFIENQSTFPNYVDAFADTFTVVPGQGRWKKFKLNGYDYAASFGKITYRPFSFLTLQAGHGKPFIGNGYRSLLLSDNAFNFPYLQLYFHSKKWSYTIIYASLQVVDKVRIYTSKLNEPLFKKKSANFHYLNYKPLSWFSIGLYEATVFRVRDSLHPYFNWNVINPVILSSTTSYGLGSSPNVLLGLDVKLNPIKDLQIYGQYVLDDAKALTNSKFNKAGFQVGVNYSDLGKIKNLMLQIEYNRVLPYTFAHKRPESGFSHYGQSMMHPLGANFDEWIVFLNYRWKDFLIEARYSLATYGADSSSSHYGKNIFASDNRSTSILLNENAKLFQGVKTNLNFLALRLSYLINSSSNMNIFAELIQRSEKNPFTERNNTLVYFGIKTALFNNYYDF